MSPAEDKYLFTFDETFNGKYNSYRQTHTAAISVPVCVNGGECIC